MMKLIERLLGCTRVLIREDERAIHLWRGRVQGILTPGEYTLPNRRNRLGLEQHNLVRPEFVSAYEKALFDRLPDVANEHLTVVSTSAYQVAVIERDGGLYAVVGPESRRTFWTAAGPWTVTLHDTSDDPAIKPAVAWRLVTERKTDQMVMITVGVGQAGLLFLDGTYERTLDVGVYGFWTAGRKVECKPIDLRKQALDVTGQEMLTKDRVTIRVNITADYQVTDPVTAVTSVKDFADTLYRAMQQAFRKALANLTLDEVLERKTALDEDATARVRADMAAIGIAVFDVTLKDVILPGDMRDILNTVVAAQKEAEANVIRRREETNATRSLLNTAKVMKDNPVMLRLKELEALETIADRVERITVHSGTDGLMNDLVRLRD